MRGSVSLAAPAYSRVAAAVRSSFGERPASPPLRGAASSNPLPPTRPVPRLFPARQNARTPRSPCGARRSGRPLRQPSAAPPHSVPPTPVLSAGIRARRSRVRFFLPRAQERVTPFVCQISAADFRPHRPPAAGRRRILSRCDAEHPVADDRPGIPLEAEFTEPARRRAGQRHFLHATSRNGIKRGAFVSPDAFSASPNPAPRSRWPA